MCDLSLVIACYNEEPILEESLREVFAVLDALRCRTEVIFVDDGSRDRTREVIDRVIAEHPSRDLRRIFHAANVGRGGTVADGIRAARGTYVGYFDIDLELPARYILPCLLALEHGQEVATILRVYKFSWRSLDRYILSKGYSWLMRKSLRIPLQDTETGFKFFRREAILPVLDETQDPGWFWDTEIMARSYYHRLRIVEIPGLFIRRFDKQSTLQPFGDTLDYLRKLWRFRAVSANLGQGRS